MNTDTEHRFTTVHSRMQVCCEVCGIVECYSNQLDAIKRAERHVAEGCKYVRVYDVMAKAGSNTKWKSQ